MRLIVLLLLIHCSSIGLFAQNNSAKQELIKAVAQFHATGDNFENSNMVSVFERIAESSTGQKDWVPAYYLSLIYARLSVKNKNAAEVNADKAIAWAKKSISIEENDENNCALSMGYTMKMAVNPILRWVTYKENIYNPLNKAKKLNPANPRIYILEGSLTLNLPKLFGGGCSKAKPILIKAKQLLDNQTQQQLLPTWGRQHLLNLNKSCPF
jgi:hypothetical protein